MDSAFELEPNDSRRLALLCGPLERNLSQLEQSFGVRIRHRGNHFRVFGEPAVTSAATLALRRIYEETARCDQLLPENVQLLLRDDAAVVNHEGEDADLGVRVRGRKLVPRGVHQTAYMRAMASHDISFGIGPAGTGKTYLAVACAAQALEQEAVERILLVRPAVEAGERLGFLPGDLSQKIDPYLRPLYDALYEMLGVGKVHRLLDRGVIEMAPLAYMRGRTLNNAFILLDEAQNTTTAQMKMFLTRVGFGSTAVITGDITQIDLPKGTQSGLVHGMQVLRDIKGISFTLFDHRDVVRHPLVQDIVEAYDRHGAADDRGAAGAGFEGPSQLPDSCQ